MPATAPDVFTLVPVLLALVISISLRNVIVGLFTGLFAGVLMIEGAAQIATFLVKQLSGWTKDQMIGLAGLDDVRVRGQIVPPARVYFVSGDVKISGRRLAKMQAQVFCNGQMTLEMAVMGVML